MNYHYPNISLNTGSSQAVIYRGIENLWGNIWSFIDGLNVEGNSKNYAYWSNVNKNSNTSTNYIRINYKLCTINAFSNRFGYDKNNDFCFLPTMAAGSSSIAPHDNYSQSNLTQGWVGYIHGGRWSHGDNCGLWCIHVDYQTEYGSFNIGTRLQYYK